MLKFTKNVPLRAHSWCSREGGVGGGVELTKDT